MSILWGTRAAICCNRCHVSQLDVRPPVANTFVDMDDLIAKPAAQ